MNNRQYPMSQFRFWILAFIGFALLGCTRGERQFKHYYEAIYQAECDYIEGKYEPLVALAREESAIANAEQYFKNGYKHGTFVHCRVYLICRRIKEASLRNDLEEVERLTMSLEKLVAAEHYPLDPPYRVNGHIDRQEVIRSITEFDKKNLEMLKEAKAGRSVGK